MSTSTPSAWVLPEKLVAAYAWEVRQQADLAAVAHSWLLFLSVMTEEQVAANWGWPKSAIESLAAQSFLSHAANVSRILFPAAKRPHQMAVERVGGEGSDQAKQLRKLLAARRDRELVDRFDVGFAVLMKEHALRDHLEHYDERMEEWAVLTSSFVRLEGPSTPGDKELEAALDIIKEDRHRQYDERTRIFWFWEVPYKLDDINDELSRIRAQVVKWLTVNSDLGRFMASRGQPF